MYSMLPSPEMKGVFQVEPERNLRRIFFVFSLLALSLLNTLDATDSSDSKQLIHLQRQIEAQVIIKDYPSALQLAQYALSAYPHEQSLHELYISVLALRGDETALMDAWKNYSCRFPEQNKNRLIIEKIAWGIIDKAASSPSILIRISALVSAFFSKGTKGVDILYTTLNDSNSALRSAAVELTAHLHDNKLKEQIKRLFFVEKIWAVKKRVIKAVGQMKIRELAPELEKILASDSTSAEEKALAAEAIVIMLDEIDRSKMEKLAGSTRMGLRLLACEIGIHLKLDRDLDLFMELAQDFHPEVRASAIQTLGQIGIRSFEDDFLLKLIQDNHPKVALNAAWLCMIIGKSIGQEVFAKSLNHNRREIRLYAAAVLATTGRYGSNLCLKYLKSHSDPYVRLNLALGLLGQRVEVSLCGNVIYDALKLSSDKWCWQEQGIFRILNHKNTTSNDASDMSPEMENQITRLEILNVLALIEDPNALKAIREFVAERTWGISGTAATLLLTEGDEEAVMCVKELLKEKNHKIRIQAALLLSLWSRDEESIKVLEEGYKQADKELKIKILEGLGRIGSMQSVPFLLKVLDEPSQTMRTISAMALIECLNH